MEFPVEFRKMVHRWADNLLAVKAALSRGEDPRQRIEIYNEDIDVLEDRFGGEWWIFRMRAFEHGALNDGRLDPGASEVVDPFRDDVPRLARGARAGAWMTGHAPATPARRMTGWMVA